MPRAAEVVVIGGGVNGSSIAYHLGRRGIRNVVLIEKGHIASGPTGLSSGVVRQHYTNETLSAMARDSVRTFARFHEEIGGDAGFVQCGVVFLAGPENASTLEATVKMHQRIGIKESLLSVDELREMEPRLAPQGVACGAYDPDGGYADPTLAANSFADAARRLGVEILQRTTVFDLRISGGKIIGVITDKGDIATGTVVNAAGPWGPKIAALAGIAVPLTVTRHAVVVLQRPPDWKSRTPVWGDLIGGWYYKPDGESGMMVGSLRDDHQSVDAENYNATATHDEIVTASTAILQRFPVMESGTARKGWAGIYDVTPDSQPVIDRVDSVPGLYCAFGFSGHGFKIAPAVGQILSELVVDGSCSSYDTLIFRHDRFQSGELHPSGYKFSIVG